MVAASISTEPTLVAVPSLDALARLSLEALAARYAAGTVPKTLAALDGDLRGRMLRLRGVRTAPLRGWVARAAASSRFVWEGKSFSAAGAVGTGINRVRLPGLLGRQRLFPFTTRVDASALDGEPAVILDYDAIDNPPYIRAIHDEVREVDRGLFLGPAMWRSAGGLTVVLWFALARGA